MAGLILFKGFWVKKGTWMIAIITIYETESQSLTDLERRIDGVYGG
jgi:hypothetical protein